MAKKSNNETNTIEESANSVKNYVLWKDEKGFYKSMADFTMLLGEAAMYKGKTAARKASKGLTEFVKIEGLQILQIP